MLVVLGARNLSSKLAELSKSISEFIIEADVHEKVEFYNYISKVLIEIDGIGKPLKSLLEQSLETIADDQHFVVGGFK